MGRHSVPLDAVDSAPPRRHTAPARPPTAVSRRPPPTVDPFTDSRLSFTDVDRPPATESPPAGFRKLSASPFVLCSGCCRKQTASAWLKSVDTPKGAPPQSFPTGTRAGPAALFWGIILQPHLRVLKSTAGVITDPRGWVTWQQSTFRLSTTMQRRY
jgi:hypothetical protein